MSEQTKFVYSANGVPFTIYKSVKPTKSGPKAYWLLEDFSTGKRRTLNNVSKQAAERRADRIREAMVKGRGQWGLFTNGELQDVGMAMEVLRSTQTGESLYTAIRLWAECEAMLNGKATLFDTVKFYLAHHQGNRPAPKRTRFDEAAKRFHEFKVASGISESHSDNLLSRLNRVSGALPDGMMLDEPTAGQLEQVVVGFGLSPKTRNEYITIIGSLYTWAAKQNPPIVPKSFNPGKEMEKFSVKHGDVDFLRVTDLKKMLARLPEKRPDLVPLVVLVCFSGLRPCEAARLEWNEVGEDYIRLPGKKSKTGYSRQIPIHTNLKLWLARWRKDAGLLCPDVSLAHVNVAIRRAAAVGLSHDAMRHGYGTHRQRVVKNIGTVAEEMGNSISVCRRHYVNAFCAETEANEWFSLVPANSGNIITLADVRHEVDHLEDAINSSS
jgi:integrase